MLFPNSTVNSSRLTRAVSVLVITVSLVACNGQQAQENGTTGEVSPGAATDTAANGPEKLNLESNVSLTGAGASFPAPLYQTWFQSINQKYPNLQVNYQSVGSGAGVEQFIKGTVDFGASDVAATDEEIKKVERGALLLPMTAGSIVLAYNLPGVEQPIRIPREVYPQIFLGDIKTWDAPEIAEANPGVNLPNEPINVVHRSDGSGTTGVFTQHLSAISPEWKQKVGAGKTVSWPTGVGAKGNEGVTSQIQQTPGSIGYVEYGYAKQNKLQVAALENQAGQFVTPTDETAANTLDAVTLPENLRAFIEDPEGEQSYPIVTYSWILAYRNYPDETTAKAVEAVVEYGLTEGQKIAPKLGYVPLPPRVVEKVAAAADQITPAYNITVNGGTNSPNVDK